MLYRLIFALLLASFMTGGRGLARAEQNPGAAASENKNDGVKHYTPEEILGGVRVPVPERLRGSKTTLRRRKPGPKPTNPLDAIRAKRGESYWKEDPGTGTLIPRGHKFYHPVAQVRYEQLTCPLTGRKFKAAYPNTFGTVVGYDHDFYVHRLGYKAVQCEVWMSPYSGYAAFYWDFGKPLPGALKKLVRETMAPSVFEWLSEQSMIFKQAANEARRVPPKDRARKLADLHAEFASDVSSLDMPDWLKVKNAIIVAEASRAPAYVMARLQRAMIHACRKGINAPINARGDPALSRAIRRITHRIAVDEEKPEVTYASAPLQRAKFLLRAHREGLRGSRLNEADLLVLRLKLAGFQERLGYLAEAAKELQQAAVHAQAIDISKQPQSRRRRRLSGLVDDRRKLLEQEREALAQCTRHLRSALAASQYLTTLTDDERRQYDVRNDLGLRCYLLAEMLRRVGRYENAAEWLAASWVLCRDERHRQRIRNRALLPEMDVTPAGNGKDAAVVLQVFKDAGVDDPKAHEAAWSELCTAIGRRAPPAQSPKAAPPPSRRLAFQGAPRTARELLTRIGRALEVYKRDHGRWPDEWKALIAAGYLTRETAGAFTDPETGIPFLLSTRDVQDPSDPIVYSKKPTRCRWVLRADGTVGEWKANADF